MKNKVSIILIVFLSLFFSIGHINASSSLKIDCDNSSLNEGKTEICYVKLSTDEETISSTSFTLITSIMKWEKKNTSCEYRIINNEGNFSCKNGKDGDTLLSFSITAPSRFYKMNLPLTLENISIKNSTSNNVESSSIYEKNVLINGSVSTSNTASIDFDLKCDNYYVGMEVNCNIILKLNKYYFNSIELSMSPSYNFSYSGKYSSTGTGTFNGKYIVELKGSSVPMVGETKIGTIKFTPDYGTNTVIFNDVELYNLISLNKTTDYVKKGTVKLTFEGVERPRTLSDLKIDGKTITGFSSDVFTYNIEVHNKSSIKIQGTAKDPKGDVEGNGTFNLKEGLNTFKVTSFASIGNRENKIKEVYTLNIYNTDNRSKINTLSSLSIENVSLNFNSDIVKYSTNVNSDVSKVTIKSTLTDSKSAYVKNYGNRTVDLKYGKNTIQIKVKAENESIKTYTIEINRNDTRSKINTLSSLSVDQYNINFNSNTLEYKIDVNSEISKVTIKSALTDSKSTYVKNYGNRTVDLKYGKNIIPIKVKAENESIKTYNIIVNRKDNRSSINTLKSLSISNGTISFNPNLLNYSVFVTKDINKITINSELTDKKSSYVKNYGNRTINLKAGENTILIKIKAENESVKTYKLVVYKELSNLELKSSTSISKLSMNGNTLEKNEDGSYNVTLNSNETELKLDVILVNNNASYEVLDNKDLEDGSVVKLKVLSEDKSKSEEFIINVKIKKEDNNQENQSINVNTESKKSKSNYLWYIVGGLGFGILLFLRLKK